jgi:hypothetical protein
MFSLNSQRRQVCTRDQAARGALFRRPGPEALAFARHKQSPGLFVSGLTPPSLRSSSSYLAPQGTPASLIRQASGIEPSHATAVLLPRAWGVLWSEVKGEEEAPRADDGGHERNRTPRGLGSLGLSTLAAPKAWSI